jgi:hypothetical protein
VSADAAAAMAESLRGQMAERVKDQHQVVVLAAAVAGASVSFGAENLTSHPEVLALLCLLFVGLSLAALRHDQEIAVIAEHLLDRNAFGATADAQARWETHKFTAMQGSGALAFVANASQAIGLYGVPGLGVAAFGIAALRSSPTTLTFILLGLAAGFSVLFLIGVGQSFARFRRLGGARAGDSGTSV